MKLEMRRKVRMQQDMWMHRNTFKNASQIHTVSKIIPTELLLNGIVMKFGNSIYKKLTTNKTGKWEVSLLY